MFHVGIYPMPPSLNGIPATTCGSHQPLGGMGKLLSAVISRNRDKKFSEDMEKIVCEMCGTRMVFINWENRTRKGFIQERVINVRVGRRTQISSLNYRNTNMWRKFSRSELLSTFFRKLLGIVCIAIVPIAIVLPGVPGDWLLLTGLALLSDRLFWWFKLFYSKNGNIVRVYAIISIVAVAGFWSFKLVQTFLS